MKNSQFILIIGLSGVGKSFFCQCLSTISGLKTINAGEALNKFLNKEKIYIAYKEDIGQKFLRYFSEQKLFQVIYDYALENNANIIDGLRLESTLSNFLSNNINSFTVYIEAELPVRSRRFAERLSLNNLSQKENDLAISKMDNYYEDIINMKRKADYIVYNNSESLLSQANTIWGNINHEVTINV